MGLFYMLSKFVSTKTMKLVLVGAFVIQIAFLSSFLYNRFSGSKLKQYNDPMTEKTAMESEFAARTNGQSTVIEDKKAEWEARKAAHALELAEAKMQSEIDKEERLAQIKSEDDNINRQIKDRSSIVSIQQTAFEEGRVATIAQTTNGKKSSTDEFLATKARIEEQKRINESIIDSLQP